MTPTIVSPAVHGAQFQYDAVVGRSVAATNLKQQCVAVPDQKPCMGFMIDHLHRTSRDRFLVIRANRVRQGMLTEQAFASIAGSK